VSEGVTMNIGQIRIPYNANLNGNAEKISGKTGKVVSSGNGKIQILVDDKLIKIEAGKLVKVKPGDIIQVFFENDIPDELEGRNIENLKAKLLEVFSLSLPFRTSKGIEEILNGFSQEEKINFARISGEIKDISREIVAEILGEDVKFSNESIKDSLSITDPDLPYDRRLLEFALKAKSMGKAWSRLPADMKKELLKSMVFYDLKDRISSLKNETAKTVDNSIPAHNDKNGNLKTEEIKAKLLSEFEKSTGNSAISKSKTAASENIKMETGNQGDMKKVPEMESKNSEVKAENKIPVKNQNSHILLEKTPVKNNDISNSGSAAVNTKDKENNILKSGINTNNSGKQEQISISSEDFSSKISDLKNSKNPILNNVMGKINFSEYTKNTVNEKLGMENTDIEIRQFIEKTTRLLGELLSVPSNIKKFVFSDVTDTIRTGDENLEKILGDLTSGRKMNSEDRNILNLIKIIIEPDIRASANDNLREAVLTDNTVKKGLQNNLNFDVVKEHSSKLIENLSDNKISIDDSKELLGETLKLAKYIAQRQTDIKDGSGHNVFRILKEKSIELLTEKYVGRVTSGKIPEEITHAKKSESNASGQKNAVVKNEEGIFKSIRKAIDEFIDKTVNVFKKPNREILTENSNISGKNTIMKGENIGVKETLEENESTGLKGELRKPDMEISSNRLAESLNEKEIESAEKNIQKISEQRNENVSADKENSSALSRRDINVEEGSKLQRLVNLQPNNYDTIYSTVFKLDSQPFKVDFYGKDVSKEKYEKNKMYRVIIETGTQLTGDVLIDAHFLNNLTDIYIYSDPEYASSFTKHSSLLLKRLKGEGFAVRNIYIRNKQTQSEIIEKKEKFLLNEMKGEFTRFA